MNHTIYWTKERCHEEALKYKSKCEYSKKSHSSYNAACKNKWIGEISSHMINKHKPNGYWSKERCREDALTCTTKKEFYEKCRGAYSASWNNGWYYEITSHLTQKFKPIGYWTKEKCHKLAFKCMSKKEFHKKHSDAYSASRKNKWLDDICTHMIPIGNLQKRLVYSYEFLNNYVYVGITCNENKRNDTHLHYSGPVFNHMNEHNLVPIKKILSSGYVIVTEAQKLEKYWVEEYVKNGWNILNRKKTGGLGGNTIYWTKEMCHVAALKCKTRKELSLKYIGAYVNSRKNKWLDDICSHMVQKVKPKGYWDYKNCKNAALKYKTRFDFSHKCSGAYFISSKNKWLDDFYPRNIK